MSSGAFLDFELDGFPQVVARMTGAAADITPRVDKELAEGAADILESMIGNIPKDRPEVVDTLKVVAAGPLEYAAGSDHFVARLLETGTSKMAPQPWVEASFIPHGGRIFAAIRREARRL